MNTNVQQYIEARLEELSALADDRKTILNSLVKMIGELIQANQTINLVFICTHNSRRSHFAQIWAQVAAHHFKIDRVNCYSGGTEATALHPLTAATLQNTGLDIETFALTDAKLTNPVYAIKYDKNEAPIIGFSKVYDHHFNPESGFVAIMTCSEADANCPFIPNAKQRIPITYEDPKISDGTPEQEATYAERSREIAREMCYIFGEVAKR